MEKIKKEHILEFLKTQDKPLNVRTILNKLKISKKYRLSIKRILQQLLREGKIQKERKKYFVFNSSDNIKRGKVEIKNGYGYILLEDEPDIYIGRKSIANLLPGDEVEVFVRNYSDGKKEGIIKNIIKRTDSPLMCKVKRFGKNYFAYSTLKKFPLIKISENNFDLNDGDTVLLYIKEENNRLSGEIISHISDNENINLLEQFILEKNEIRQEFPLNVLKEAENINFDTIKKEGRVDLRDETIITIDPYDAKDFDDAISIKKTGNIYELGVHIADVSYFVKEGSDMDYEAFLRGVSVYLPKRAIPMLPEKLSNDICSLKEWVDRFTFSIFMKIDKTGEILSYEIKESIINNKKRYTYEEVQEILKGRIEPENKKIKELLLNANQLKDIIGRKLSSDGMIDLNIGEPSFIYTTDNEIYNIIRKGTLDSHKLIEYFMIYANICAADFITKNYKSGIFRVHPEPDEKDIRELNLFLNTLGTGLKMKKGSNIEFQKIIKGIENLHQSELIKKKLLRAMQLARYSEKNTGHFGLSLEKYSHFTSPIRRYADIVAHRLIKSALKLMSMKDNSRAYLKDVAQKISACEEKAEKSEMEVFKLYALNFLKNKIKEEFYAIITKITNNGFFAELENYPIEGFISFDNIYNDYYEYDFERQIAIGRRTKKIFKIGSRIKVVITKIDLELLRMNLELAI